MCGPWISQYHTYQASDINATYINSFIICQEGLFYSFPQNQVTMETLCSIPVNNVELHNDVTLRKRERCELLWFEKFEELRSLFWHLGPRPSLSLCPSHNFSGCSPEARGSKKEEVVIVLFVRFENIFWRKTRCSASLENKLICVKFSGTKVWRSLNK